MEANNEKQTVCSYGNNIIVSNRQLWRKLGGDR